MDLVAAPVLRHALEVGIADPRLHALHGRHGSTRHTCEIRARPDRPIDHAVPLDGRGRAHVGATVPTAAVAPPQPTNTERGLPARQIGSRTEVHASRRRTAVATGRLVDGKTARLYRLAADQGFESARSPSVNSDAANTVRGRMRAKRDRTRCKFCGRSWTTCRRLGTDARSGLDRRHRRPAAAVRVTRRGADAGLAGSLVRRDHGSKMCSTSLSRRAADSRDSPRDRPCREVDAGRYNGEVERDHLAGWSPEQIAAGRRWVQAWKEAGPRLEQVRREELRRLHPQRAIALLCGEADYTRPPRAPRPTSGLVEQQRWFMRAASRRA